MANQFDRRRINVKGGGFLQVRELDPTPTNGWGTIGFIQETTLNDAFTMVEAIDDSGRFIDNKEGGEKLSLETTLMQSNKDEIDLMKNAAEKYFEVYYKVTLNNGDFQEFVIPVARIIPGVEMKFAAGALRGIPLKTNACAPATSLTRTPTAYNTAQWQMYVLTEGVAANNAPSDNATVPAAAI